MTDSPETPEAPKKQPEKTEQPELPGAAPPPAEKDESNGPGFPTFVTQIKTAEQQVGEHIVRALEHEGTVAVITIVQGGGGGQSIVSIPLSADVMQDVQVLLQNEAKTRPAPKGEVPCVGFHCVVEARAEAADDTEPKS